MSTPRKADRAGAPMSVNVPDDQWNAAARDAGLEPVGGAPLTAEERAEILQRIERGYVWGFQVRNDMARLLAALDAAEAERDELVSGDTTAAEFCCERFKRELVAENAELRAAQSPAAASADGPSSDDYGALYDAAWRKHYPSARSPWADECHRVALATVVDAALRAGAGAPQEGAE